MRIRLGTRGSRLALVQAQAVGRMLEAAGAAVEIVVIKTSGDRLALPLAEVGGKGLFVKEIDEALIEGRIDAAVHSMKDMPAALPRGIAIAAVPPREDPRDAFISAKAASLGELPRGASVGTSSPRRRAQILKSRPDLNVIPMRGNVETRLKKLDAGEADALVLAAAGLKRLGLQERISSLIPTEEMIPAAGQGALAIEAREEDRSALDFIGRACGHGASMTAARAERALLEAVGGDCHTPLAAHAEVGPGGIRMIAFLASKDGGHEAIARDGGPAEDAAAIGKRLGERLLDEIHR